jgi:hypothetical protein
MIDFQKSETRSGFVFYCREDRIRTCDPLVPNQVRYRAALLPEKLFIRTTDTQFYLTEPATLPILIGMRYRAALLPEKLFIRTTDTQFYLTEPATLPILIGMRYRAALLPEKLFIRTTDTQFYLTEPATLPILIGMRYRAALLPQSHLGTAKIMAERKPSNFNYAFP